MPPPMETPEILTLIAGSLFSLFSLWWVCGLLLRTRSRHSSSPWSSPTGLDKLRLALLLLALTQGLAHYTQWEALVFRAFPWLALLSYTLQSSMKRRPDNAVTKIGPMLGLGYGVVVVGLGRGEEGKVEDALVVALYGVIAFVFVCLKRDSGEESRRIGEDDSRVGGEGSFLLRSGDEGSSGELQDPLLKNETPQGRRKSPEDRVGLWSILTFAWLSDLMKTGYARTLIEGDLYNVRREDQSTVLYASLQTEIKKQRDSLPLEQQAMAKPKLVAALVKSGIVNPFIFAAPLKLIYDTLLFVGPAQVLRMFIEFMQEEKQPGEVWYKSRGLHLAFALFAVGLFSTIILQLYFSLVFRAGMRARAALVSIIYVKSLKLSQNARNSKSSGEIQSLMSVDGTKIGDLFPYLHVAWSSPYQLVLCVYFLFRELHWAAIVAFAFVFVLLVTLTNVLVRKAKEANGALMKSRDVRIRVTTETISSMKIVKLYGWETTFQDRIQGAREEELKTLRRYVYLSAINRTLFLGSPILVSLVAFVSFVYLGGELDAATAFVSVTLLNLLRFPLMMLPAIFNGIIEANTSFKRIEAFLALEELKSLSNEPPAPSPSRKNSVDSQEAFRHSLMSPYPTFGGAAPRPAGGPAIECVSGTFFWDDECTKPAVRDVELKINEGELVVVTGAVASGKTALFLSLLGELTGDPSNPPFVSMNGSVAYAPQVPWIRNATFRENILFGEEFQPEWYQEVVAACALESDLELLPAGDATEIGERGINLSGGQKARISLARAVYSRSDILLLESCFEAVDEHVASHLWQKCFFGVLKRVPSKNNRKRAVVIITHSTKSEVDEVDRVIAMSKGRLLMNGSPDELWKDPAYQKMREIRRTESKASVGSSQTASSTSTALVVSTNTPAVELEKGLEKGLEKPAGGGVGQKIMTEEAHYQSAEKRGLEWRVLRMYMASLGGSFVFAFVLLVSSLRITGDILTSRWLAHWSNEAGKPSAREPEYYVSVYSALSLIAFILVATAYITVFLMSLRSSKTIHEALISSVMRSPMSFFDTTPQGRIINRFTKDMSTVDFVLPGIVSTLIQVSFDVLATIIVVGIVAPLFLIPLPVLAILYIFVQRYYVASSRELKRLDSITLSPIFSHFGETIDGSVSIRAYKATDRFVRTNHTRLDRNLAAYYASVTSNRWLAVRMESISNFMVLMAATLTAAEHGKISASLAALSVSYTLLIGQSLNWGVRMASDFESNVVAVERLDEYAHGLPAEAPLDVLPSPPENWPSRGEILFRNVSARYRDELPLVLQELTLRIAAGSHVGIVGRTGSGKSTILLLLLRIIEPIGAIEIDGVDIRSVGLRLLRDKVSIVPQDPVLFQASLRYNLDPTCRASDAEIWRTLEICGLSDYIKSLIKTQGESAIDVPIAEGGADFSFGLRQLICLARAVLRRTRITVIDEGTSGIDRASDVKIQETLRAEFASCTTITIAHRLDTILSSDSIIVMDKGRIIEHDSPKNLLENQVSEFAGLVREMTASRNQ